MYDINFFSVFKKKKSKNNGFKVFAIIAIALLIIFNVAVIGGGLFVTNNIKNSIAEKEAYIKSEDTVAKIAAANKVRKEADLTTNYLEALKLAATGFEQINRVNTALMSEIRKMTPVTTVISSSLVEENLVTLNCVSANTSDPIDMYHAILTNKLFANVSFSGFLTDPASGISSFTIAFQVLGGVQP